MNVADSDGRPLLRTVYFTNGDWETRAFWTMVVLYIYFILKELVEMQSLGLKLYFSELWNIYELVDLYCLYKAFDTMYSFQDISTQVEGELLRSENELVYYDVMASGGVRSMYRDVKKWMALNAFTAVLKIFKYLKLSSRMNSLWEVLERALSDMLAFMLILFFIMAGFGVFGVVLFGDHVREFHNVPSAFNTLLYWTIGDFSTVDYDIMTQARYPILTRI